MGRVSKVRLWLKQNKVFFETIAAFVLSVAAIYVSYQASKISEQQADLAKMQAMPYIEVHGTQRYDEIKKFYSENIIEVYNRSNGMLRSFQCSSAVFLTVKKTESARSIETSIPLLGYHYVFSQNGSSQGLLMTIGSHENNIKLNKIITQIRDYPKRNDVIIVGELRQLVRTTYVDILGKRHIEYFSVPIGGYGTLVSEEKGIEVFDQYDNGFKAGTAKDIDKISIDDVLLALDQQKP